MPENARLKVTPLTRDDAAAYADDDANVLFACDIQLLLDDETEYQPEAPVAVAIRPPEPLARPVSVLHVANDATTTAMANVTTTDDGAAAFLTDAFSIYILMAPMEAAVYPSTIYWNGSGFFSDVDCGVGTEIVDGEGVAIEDLPTLLAALGGDTTDYTIYMKAGYPVSGAVSINGGTVNDVTLERYSTYTAGALITVSSGSNLTLANITLDGGAVWSGSDATLGRGTTNTGVSSTEALIINNGTLLITGATLRNNDNTYTVGRGGAITNSGALSISGSTITRITSAAGSVVRQVGGSLEISGTIMTANHGRDAAGAISIASGNPIVFSGCTFTNNLDTGTGYGGGAISSVAPITIRGGTISGNKSTRRGDGVNAYTSTTLTLSGSPNISDEVYLDTATNKIFVDNADFNPGSAIPLVLGTYELNRVVVTYTAGTPNLDHFSIPSTAPYQLGISGNNIILEVKTPIAIIHAQSLTIGSTITSELEHGTAVSWQWQRRVNGEWVNITGAQSANYQAAADDAGKEIRVVIGDGDQDYASDSVTITLPAFTITIPDAIEPSAASASFSVACVSASSLGTARISVTVASANYQGGHKLLLAANGAALSYTLRATQGGAAIGQGGEVTSFSSVRTQTVYLDVLDAPFFAGDYTDTLTFTATLVDAS